MRHLLPILSLLLTFTTASFGQNNVENKRAVFLNGVQLEKPDFIFHWSFKIDDIPKEKFINYQVDKKSMSVWTHIKFDSVSLSGFLLNRVIVKVTKKRKEDKVRMREFIGVVDFATLEKLTEFFTYKWQGWMSYPKEKPVYKFILYKNKKEGGIVIDWL